MVTKGIIRSIDFNGNTCVVRLPLFEPAGDSEPVEITAIISNTPGSYNGYLVDDVVLVAFEDGLVEQPVVIGKLYLGANIEKNTPRGVVNVTDSSASEKANIPFDTTLGSSLDEDMPNTQANYKTINEISNELNKTNSNLDNQVRDINNELVGKIDSEKNGTSFGWKVTDNSWSIFQTVNKGTDEEKTTNILYADKDGLKVTGDIEATTGHIGEFVIGQTHDCSEILDENNKPTKQSGIYSEGYINKFEAIPESKGVYVGTDGIKVGKSFSVDSNGHLTASSFSFEGLGKDSLTYSNINLQDGLKNGNGILMAFGEEYGEEYSDSHRDGDYNYTSWWFQDSYILDLTSANSDDATIKDFINNTTGDSFAEDSDNSNYEEIREVNAFEKSTNTFRMPVRGWGFLQFPVCAQNLSSDSIHVLSFKFRVRPIDTNLFSTGDTYYDDWRPSRFVQLVNTLKFFGYVGRKKDVHRYDGRSIGYWEQTMWPICFEGNDRLISAVGDDEDFGYVVNGDVLFDNEKTRDGAGEINNAIRIENNWLATTSVGFDDVKIISTKLMDPSLLHYYGNTDREVYYTPASKQFYAWGRVDQQGALLNPDSDEVSRLYFDWFRLNVDGPWVTVKFYFKTPKEIDENMCIQIGYINECYDDEVRKFINDGLPEDLIIDRGDWNPENIWDDKGLSIFEVKEVKIEHNEIATSFNYSLNDRTISSGHGLTAIINAQNKNDVYFEWYNKENSLTGFNSGIMVSDYPNSSELGSLIQIVGTSTDTQTNYIITVEVVGVTTELTDQGARDVYLVNTKSFMRSGAFTSTWLETSTPVHTGSNSSTPITITARSKTGTMLEANSSTSTIKYKWEGDSSYTTSSTNPLVIEHLQNKNLIVVLYESENLIDTETITYSPLNTPIIDLTNDNATILYDNDTKLGLDVSTTAYLYLNGEVVPNTTYAFTANNCIITTSNNTVVVTALSANSATVTCTATVNNFNPAYNGKSYTKVFNITKQLKGAPGTNGQTISVENSFVYALGNNSSTAPNNNYSTWSPLILTPTSQNPYVWAVSRRETIVDGVSTVTYGTTPFVYQTLEDFVSILSADGIDLIYKTTTGGKDAYHMRADNIVGSIGDKVNIGGVRTDNDTDTPTFDGGWTIKSETKDQQGHVTTPAAIYSSIESMEDTTHHEGVYIGTNGIKLGQNFSVTDEGIVSATQFNYLETSGQNTYKNIQDGNNNCDDAYLIVGKSAIDSIYSGQSNWNDSIYQVQTAANSSGFNANEDRYEIQFNSSDYTPERLYVNGEYTEVYPDKPLGLHSALVLPKVKLQRDTTYTLSFKFKFPGNENWMGSTKINRICAVVDTESNIKNLLRKFRNWYGAYSSSSVVDNKIFSSAYSILGKLDYDAISADITNNWKNPTYTTTIISSSKGGSSSAAVIDTRYPYTKSKYLSDWDGSTKYFAKSVKSTLISSLENTNIVRRCTDLRVNGAGHTWTGYTGPDNGSVLWGNYTTYYNGSSWATRKDTAVGRWGAVDNTLTLTHDYWISGLANSECEFSTTFKTGLSWDDSNNLRTLILFELIDINKTHRNSNQKYTLYVNNIQLEQGSKSNFKLSVNDSIKESDIFAFKAGDGFGITPWGKIIAKNAEIHGDIKSGTIGGFTIGDQGLWKFNPINGETLQEEQVTSKFVKENLKLSTLNYYTGATNGNNIKAATFNGSYIGRRALYLGEATTAKIGDNYYSFGGDEDWNKEQQYAELNRIIQADTSSIKDASQTRQVLLTSNGLSMSQIAKQYEITAVYDHDDNSFGGYDARLVSTTNFGEVNFENEQDPCLTIRSYGDKMIEGQHFNHMIRLQAINSTTSGTSTWKNDTNIWISPLSFEVNLGDNQYDACQEYGRCNRGFIILNAGRIEVGAGSNRRSYWEWDYSRNQNVSSPAQIYLGGYVYINGTQFGTSPSTTSSDINLKKDIEDLSSNYDVLFDNLKPVRFKYKDGNSSRFHTGLIAQDLQEAIKTAELTEKDVAAIVTVHDEDQKTHKKFEYLGIRYEELIALNIDQIQKLKKRVTELEEQLNKTEKSS